MKQVILPFLLLLTACHSDQVTPAGALQLDPSYDATMLPLSNDFESPRSQCRIADKALNEISGLSESVRLPGNFWVEEDSGNENKIYLISPEGKTIGMFLMTTVDNRDWEDMVVAAEPSTGVPYIYLAEIGDNTLRYSTKYIYRFPEPELAGKPLPIVEEISSVDKIAFQYPDGIKNAEAMLIDPNTLDLYILTKDQQSTVYVLPYPQSTSKVTMATKLGKLPISLVTSASISANGSEILIRNYTTILYWKRLPGETIPGALSRSPVRLIYQQEPKGEAICWANSGSGYFTSGEMVDTTAANLYSYKRH